ncbi:MAG: hypothetical protein DWQ20_00905 [Actinobacteria bacterium]|nr:MAG: hypothetical protein DWQ20_00905 [Actinomycetota bacterium]
MNETVSKRTFILSLTAIGAVVTVAVIIAVVSVHRHQINQEISAQRDVERNEKIQDEKTKRTQERSDALRDIVPWSKDGK